MKSEFPTKESSTRAGLQRALFPALSLLLPLLVAIILSAQGLPAFADQADKMSMSFITGFSPQVLADADARDVDIAMSLWARELARTLPVKKAEIFVAKSLKELQVSITAGDCDLVTLSAFEYLQIRDRAKLLPILVGANNVGRSREYLLLVRSDSGIGTLKDLRGKTIILPAVTKSYMSHLWLEVLLLRVGNQDSRVYFRQVMESGSSSKAMIALFFGKADATIVNRGTFETAKALNPQLGVRLKVIAESKSLAENISCLLASHNQKTKSMVEDAGLHLHDTVTGRQVLTLFKIDRIISYKPSYLDGLVELLQERDRLLTKNAKRRDHGLR
jgi:ABC-type phosphate/phosphonate transport system substrate-binding protein